MHDLERLEKLAELGDDEAKAALAKERERRDLDRKPQFMDLTPMEIARRSVAAARSYKKSKVSMLDEPLDRPDCLAGKDAHAAVSGSWLLQRRRPRT